MGEGRATSYRPAWEISFLIVGERDEVEAIYDQMQDIACNCDGSEDAECRCPVQFDAPTEGR